MRANFLVPVLLVAVLVASSARAGEGGAAMDADNVVTDLATARANLRSISKRAVQLWVVVHVRANKNLQEDGTVDEDQLMLGALADADAVVRGGADAIVLINSRCAMPLYERVISAVRGRHPGFPLIISALSYGPENLTEGYRLAQRFDARGVWLEVTPGTEFEFEVDDEGSYERAELTPRSLARAVAATQPGVMLLGGVHMKYTRGLDGRSFEESMARARFAVHGVNITGVRTGRLADVERVRAARKVAGRWPMGLASGVSVENIGSVIDQIDYAIVGTSLKVPGRPLRTSESRVRELRRVMDGLTRGRAPVR